MSAYQPCGVVGVSLLRAVWISLATDASDSAVFNIILDFLVLGLPIFQLWKMNLNKRKKFLVMLMFGVGFLVTITSIMRLHAIVGYGENKNFTWVRVEPGLWVSVPS